MRSPVEPDAVIRAACQIRFAARAFDAVHVALLDALLFECSGLLFGEKLLGTQLGGTLKRRQRCVSPGPLEVGLPVRRPRWLPGRSLRRRTYRKAKQSPKRQHI